MVLTTSDFTIAQLEAFVAAKCCLSPAGLRARLDALDTGEVVAVYRPRDPHHDLWFVSPTESDRVAVVTMPTGRERELPSMAAALEWIAAVELGEAPDPVAHA